MEQLQGPKIHDHSENDIGQLHKTISEFTKELEMKEILRSNEKMVSSTRRIALASLDMAQNAMPNIAAKNDLTS